MKDLILIFLIIGVGFTACRKEQTLPDDVRKVLYSGDSVRYNVDSLPAALPAPPQDHDDYYKLVQVYSNNTMVVDYTCLLDNGYSVTYRAFIRYSDGMKDDLKGWYRRRKITGFVIPVHKEVVIYHTIPYTIPENMEDIEVF